MKKLPSSYLEPKIFDNKYIIKQQLSQGSFGIVYLAIQKITKEEVAVKLEKGDHETLDREVYLLTKLQGIPGVPKLYWFGAEQNYNVMVIELLGKDLGHYNRVYKTLSIKSGLQLADQLLLIFKQVHNRGVVHRDLKPENIMLCKKNSSQVYLVDYGVSKQVFDKNNKHIPFRDKKSFIGTTRYASIAAHRGFEIGRKDDLESMMYVVIFMIQGYKQNSIPSKLPWQNLQNIGDKDRTDAVGEVKQQISVQQLCKELPKEFADYLNYLKTLQFDEAPDYEMLRAMLKRAIEPQQYDGVFEWSDKEKAPVEAHKEQRKPSSFLAVPLDQANQRANTKRTSRVSNQGSQSSNLVKYVPSFQDVLQTKPAPQTISKIATSQPHIDLNRIETVDFDDIDENTSDYPTLEQKYLQLSIIQAHFKEGKSQKQPAKSAINIFE